MRTTAARVFALSSCLASVGVTAIPTWADPPIKQAARLDAVGDPLPEGAVARLGTLRLVHRGYVTAVAVAPDGKLAASGVERTPTVDGAAVVREEWDEADAKPALPSPRGIRLWDTRTGKLIRALPTPASHTSCLLFSADGADLYGGNGSHLGCWNPHTGEQRWMKSTLDKRILQRPLPATSLVLAGDRLVSVHAGSLSREFTDENGTAIAHHSQMAVRIWNRKTGALEPLPAALESTNTMGQAIPVLFQDVAVSADGRVAAVIASQAKKQWRFPKAGPAQAAIENKEVGWQYPNPRLRIVDLGTGAVRHDFPAVSFANTHMTFSEDGRRLAITAGKQLWLVEVASGRKTRVAVGVPEVQELRFVPGTRQIAAQLADQSIRVWDSTTGRAIEPHAVRSDAFQASWGGAVAAIANENTIRLVDRLSGKPLLDFVGHREAPSICFGSGPASTLSSLDSEQLYRWEADTWKVQQHVRFPPPIDRGWCFGTARSGMTLQLVAPDAGLRLMNDGKALTLHDLRTGKLIRTLDANAREWRNAYFSPNGARVISAEANRTVFFDAGTGQRLATITHPSKILAFGAHRCSPVVSPTGKLFATSVWHSTDVDLIAVDTGKQLRKLSVGIGADPDRRAAILQLWFSPDERFVLAELHRQLEANSPESAEIVVWDAGSGALVQRVMVVPRTAVWRRNALQICPVAALAMSFDRRLMALARDDRGDIEIWDTASATKRGSLPGHAGVVTDLAFSPDGRYLASASDDTTILVWDLNRPWHAAEGADKLTPAELTACWRTLGEPDAARADTAIWQLVQAKVPAVALLKGRLKPRLRPDPMHVRRLLSELDSDDFNTRTLAQADLERLGELVLGELKAALAQPGSLERRRRVQFLLAHAERATLPFGTPDRRREWRALEVLARAGSPEAVALLQALAAGAPSAPLTAHAAEVLARLQPARK